MKCKNLSLKGIKLIYPKIFIDERGFFLETYNKTNYESIGIWDSFVQDNHSYSKKNVIRGMHYREGQSKLVSVIVGKIYDVFVDIRRDSPTYGKWDYLYLDDKSNNKLFIPPGFAHGFCVLSDFAHVYYKVNSEFNSSLEKGFRFDDPEINITWPVKNPIISEKDKNNKFFKDAI